MVEPMAAVVAADDPEMAAKEHAGHRDDLGQTAGERSHHGLGEIHQAAR